MSDSVGPAGRIRAIEPGHVADVVRLVHDLALYEKLPELCRLTDGQLHEALFGPAPALFGLVAESEPGRVGGFALYFLNFSTWEGVHGIYLEDL